MKEISVKRKRNEKPYLAEFFEELDSMPKNLSCQNNQS